MIIKTAAEEFLRLFFGVSNINFFDFCNLFPFSNVLVVKEMIP